MKLPIQELDCMSRMFLSCLCVSDQDLAALGVVPEGCSCCLSLETQGRSILHRLLVEDDALARRVTDGLDLRYLDEIAHVRSLGIEELAAGSRRRGRADFQTALVGWAWALATGEREDAQALGRQLMGECYVRGMRCLAEGEPYRAGLHS